MHRFIYNSAALLSLSAKMAAARQPTVFLSHGGGPAFYLEPGELGGFEALSKRGTVAPLYSKLGAELSPRPKQILVISAHWESDSPTTLVATSNAHPPLLFDYYGFPASTYELKWPVLGSPDLVGEVAALLKPLGLAVAADPKRGLDHGVFVPLKLVFPDADIPVVQLSLAAGLDPLLHFRVGQALAPLRSAGVLIVGSGQATHNLSTIRAGLVDPKAAAFDAWLSHTMEACSPAERARRLLRAEAEAPHFRAAHPREEHFTPIYVALGAASPSLDAAALARASAPVTELDTAAAVSASGEAATVPGAASAAARRVIDHPIVMGSMSLGSWVLQ